VLQRCPYHSRCVGARPSAAAAASSAVEALPCQVRPGACCSHLCAAGVRAASRTVWSVSPAAVRRTMWSVPPAVPWPCRRLPGSCRCPYRQPYNGRAAGCQVRAAVRIASRTMAMPQAARAPQHAPSVVTAWAARSVPLSLHGCGQYRRPHRRPPCPCQHSHGGHDAKLRDCGAQAALAPTRRPSLGPRRCSHEKRATERADADERERVARL
jgi:hypothetical protein